MIRQARAYMVGAMSGASLIAVAIAVFVLLVSTQVFGDWPVAGLLGGGEEPGVSKVKEATAPVEGSAAGPAKAGAAGTTAGGNRAAGAEGGGAAGVGNDQGGSGAPASGEGGSAGGGGGAGGEEGSAPEGGSGGGSGGNGAASGGGGGGSGAGSAPTTTTTTSSPSSKVTGAVDETVHHVDETATDGALEESGVTETTEEAVNGVAGSESPVGKVVDETAKSAEGVTKTVEALGR
jgi:hypothetical protein